MNRTSVLPALGIVFGFGLPYASATSSVYYDASVKKVLPGDTAALYYNPGPDDGGQPDHILFDDVTVQSSLPQTLFNVTKVTYGITRLANAPAVQITPYFCQLVPDSQLHGGLSDGPDFDPLVQLPTSQFATPLSLPANGSSLADGQEISFGDGVHTLFNVPGAFASADTNFRSFGIGLKFSTTDNSNGWTIAENPDNLDLVWDYLNSTNFAEFTYQFGSQTVIGTQYVKVQGLVLSGVPGDANSDGKVDVTDLGALATSWQQSGDYSSGDFNFDGFVDVSDLGVLATDWQVGVSGPALSQALADVGLGGVNVPEPASLVVGALIPLGFVLCSRRRKSAPLRVAAEH